MHRFRLYRFLKSAWISFKQSGQEISISVDRFHKEVGIKERYYIHVFAVDLTLREWPVKKIFTWINFHKKPKNSQNQLGISDIIIWDLKDSFLSLKDTKRPFFKKVGFWISKKNFSFGHNHHIHRLNLFITL